MQELTHSIKRLNLRIMGMEEGANVQAKRICNIFIFEVQEAYKIPNKIDQNRTNP
jgi:hypothetical protein